MDTKNTKGRCNPDLKLEKTRQLRRERRRQNVLERLGSNHPVCTICGESDPRTLELHHIAGRDYDKSTVPVCRNCHRKLSDLQKDHPDKITPVPDTLEVIAHFLEGLADFFELLVVKLREFARHLIERCDVNALNVEPSQP
jgi:hypothetical protein